MKLANINTLTFDLIEIIAELEISHQKFTALKPVKTGSQVPHFSLKKENINKGSFLNRHQTNSSLLLRQISDKPLVISFYSSAWQQYGLEHLTQLNSLHQEIKALGANLLILSADEPNAQLEELLWNNSLQLNFYFDEDNQIAQKFGLFSAASPAWYNYPGIEENVPLLATYVVDQANRVIFDDVDYQLRGPAAPDKLLRALQTNALYVSTKRSA